MKKDVPKRRECINTYINRYERRVRKEREFSLHTTRREDGGGKDEWEEYTAEEERDKDNSTNRKIEKK